MTDIEINNVKKTPKHFFGSRDSRIIIKANPNPLYLNINVFQQTYYYPSNPFSFILFSNLNPLNWFNYLDEVKQLDSFIQGKLHQSVLLLEQKIEGADYLFVCFFFFFPLFFIYSIFAWFFTDAVFYRYEINAVEKILIISGQRLFLKNTERQYQLDAIEQIKLNTGYKTNFNSGRIILKFEPDYDYPLDEFFNVEEGEANFQTIKSFIDKSR